MVLPSVPKPEKKPRLQTKQLLASPSFDVSFPMHHIPGSKDSKPNNRTDEPVFGLFQQGMFFKTWEEARDAIYEQEEACGHKWIKHQTKMSKNGSNVVRITFRCNRQSFPTPKHSTAIDPSDLRHGKSSRVGCQAHVNVCRNPGGWHLGKIELDHNHERSIPPGGKVSRPPTVEQRSIIIDLTKVPNLTRAQVAKIVENRAEFSKPLEPRQISNIITKARSDAREVTASMGGDFAAILADLKDKSEAHGWVFEAQIDASNTVTGLYWQTAEQVQLCQRYSDILLNDNSYNRNNVGYSLNLGLIIDNHGKSRNAFQVLHASEDSRTHSWVLRSYSKYSKAAPEVFGSDRDAALIQSAREVIPLSLHMYCLHHAQGNIVQHARRSLQSSFGPFMQDFWAAYRGVSPEEFDRLWNHLTSTYPPMKDYLDRELYPCRKQWAWAWISTTFTAGVQTTGRVESENRVTQASLGAKSSPKQLYDVLNERVSQQTTLNLQRVRDVCNFLTFIQFVIHSLPQSSRRQHGRPIESIFPGPLALLREHAGPFALHKCYEQMELSLSYKTEVIHRPEGIRYWVTFSLL